MNTKVTHKTIIATLSPELRKTLMKRSDLAGSKQCASHFGLIVLSSLYIYFRLPVWQLVLPVRINKVISHICGLLIFVPAIWFKQFHFAHHRHTNQAHLDPELSAPKPQTRFEYWLYLSGIPVGISLFKTILNNALANNRDDFVHSNQRFIITLEAIIYSAIYLSLFLISIWFNSSLLIFLWIIPLFLGQPFLRAYLLAEHALCPQVDNMLLNSRTTLTTSVVRFIAWNMPYHAEHHALPSIPFYKLPEFHQYIKNDLAHIENGYIRFHKKMVMQCK